ncbi:hypothetical protein DFR58_12315 [Anaerobacterium chartisolvens]|uniref:Uncharacterized protein n=1 Tax=Anaerobacterium chartisolvens TaxID=1297424 RepID=A0A369ASZ5_9FIRM|nr:hypothetical protein [Anaerobacterium chartisolvens]RCX12205.1 hypothetical protein DFR58_12315 [Anaerobacterium chartisolvens]
MNNYSNPYINSGYMPDYTNRQNIYMLHKKTGDVNGSKIADTVYLMGEKGENPFYENIKVGVQDGRTLQWYVIPLYPNYSMAFNPWLFLGNFTGLNVDEIMVNLPVGGSGALTYYYIISFLNNNANYILGPEQLMPLTKSLELEVIYMDNYKVLVKSRKLNQSIMLDVSDRKDAYEGTVYNREGKLIKPRKGFVIDQPHLYPVRFDGNQPYKLEAQQDIAGTSHADRLGYAVTYWKYSAQDKSWLLDPKMFFVLV